MHLSSILLFIFLFIHQNHYTFSFWSKSKIPLENYTIDVLFTNSLTIIRCNPYERHILRVITIESAGHIRCSNSHEFLPNDHIEEITLLQWNYTSIECSKDQKQIKKEKTYCYMKHKAKDAFKKVPLDLTRVGSTGSSRTKMNEKKFQMSFEHLPRDLALVNADQTNKKFATEIYSFRNRPILCRERQLVGEGPCSNEHLNASFVCYYKVSDSVEIRSVEIFVHEIGVAEPPTITEMESELKTLPADIDPNGNKPVDRYVNKTPKQKSIWNQMFPIGIGVIGIIIFVSAGIGVYYYYTRSKNIRYSDSESSN